MVAFMVTCKHRQNTHMQTMFWSNLLFDLLDSGGCQSRRGDGVGEERWRLAERERATVEGIWVADLGVVGVQGCLVT